MAEVKNNGVVNLIWDSSNPLREAELLPIRNWPSAEALRFNKMPLITSIDYANLFLMLRAKRFDYILRGVHSGFGEERSDANAGLMVEPTLLLRNPGRFYFFVNKKNTALADRLERGLRIALKDRSFDKLFQSVDDFRRSEAEIKSGRRHVIDLAQP